jgi:fibronectin type III domain protein/Kelch motif protein
VRNFISMKHLSRFVLVLLLASCGGRPLQDERETQPPRCASTASRPGAPGGLEMTARVRSVEAHWSAPASDGGCAITSYKIRVHATESAARVVSTSGTSLVVDGFVNFDRVCLYVSAVNDVGIGPDTSAANPFLYPCVQLADIPFDAANVAAFLEGHSVNLSWTPPERWQYLNQPQHAMLPLLDYRVVVEPTGTVFRTPDGATTEMTIPGLQDGTEYTFVVQSENAAGLSHEVRSNAIRPPLSTWKRGPRLPEGEFGHASFVWNGALYTAGGTAASLTPVQAWYAPLDTNGVPISWQPAGSFPAEELSATVFATTPDGQRAFVYAISGPTSGPAILRSEIGPDGTLSSPTRLPDLPFARGYHAAVAHNGVIYVLGGYDPLAPRTGPRESADVFLARIDSQGGVGEWSRTTSMPEPRELFAAAFVGDFLVVVGGEHSWTDVSYARVREDGTLDPWQRAPSPLPRRLTNAAALAVGARLYVAGGDAGGSWWSARVLMATMDQLTGKLSPWEDADPMVGPREQLGFAASGSSLYVTGGRAEAGATLSTVQYARIDPQTGKLLRQE